MGKVHHLVVALLRVGISVSILLTAGLYVESAYFYVVFGLGFALLWAGREQNKAKVCTTVAA